MALSTLAPPPVEDAKPGVTGAAVALGSRVDIYPASPLPDLNCDGGMAFAARYRGDAGSDLIGIVCNSGLPARFDLVNSLRSIDHPAIFRIVETGVVTWPDGMRYASFAFQRPSAPRFMRSLDETHPPITEDVLNRRFVQPLAGALAELMRTGVAHGAIRPTNLFWRYGAAAPPQLGECLSLPAGVRQPVMFETIERGMAMPLGRGAGLHGDDCYAFGVMLAMLIMGHNPFKGMGDDAILRAKMENGSFNAIVGHHRLAANHIELLRGLLTDDAHQRWSAADLEQWLSGRRLTPKSSDIGRRASRHFDFGGKEYWQLRPLASALAAHVPEAVRMIESGALDKWLRRSLGDDDRADDANEAVSSLRALGKNSNYEEQLTARVCMALDPAAPIRYRGLSIMPAGIAGMLAHAIITGGKIDVLADIIGSQLVIFWIEMQKQMKIEMVPLTQQFDRLTAFLEKNNYGGGIERAVYELNPSLPCLSTMLRSQYVMTPKAMLAALERVAAMNDRPREPMDRHIAAYLIVRDRRSEGMMEAMNAPETSPRRALAMVLLYSEMQNRYGPESLPNLAKWLGPLLEPATKRFFGKTLREAMSRQLKEATEHGDLAALGRLIDNPQRLVRDEQDFIAARLLYFNIMKEINALEGRMASREKVVNDIGRPLAASISGMIALLAVIFCVARVVWTNM